MIILPAIDLHEGKCVRLYQGEYSTAEVVAADAVETAREFAAQGAHWIHMVDLDGAKAGKPINNEIVRRVKEASGLRVEIGGGIRNMETAELYLQQGIDRVILGSAVIRDPAFLQEAIKRYGKRIAVGIDARDGKVAVEGWTDNSEVHYLDLAKEVDRMGASYIIFTDIRKDGTLSGPSFEMLNALNRSVKCNVIASGGVSCLNDITDLKSLNLYGAIAGKAIYSKSLDLAEAVQVSRAIRIEKMKSKSALDDEIDQYFMRADLIPAIVQDDQTNEVLMLAYMNRESLEKTLRTGYTWFYSRSRQSLWNKGETSGHTQRVASIYADCDDDAILIRVEQKGVACHTGRYSCFFHQLFQQE